MRTKTHTYMQILNDFKRYKQSSFSNVWYHCKFVILESYLLPLSVTSHIECEYIFTQSVGIGCRVVICQPSYWNCWLRYKWRWGLTLRGRQPLRPPLRKQVDFEHREIQQEQQYKVHCYSLSMARQFVFSVSWLLKRAEIEAGTVCVRAQVKWFVVRC